MNIWFVNYKPSTSSHFKVSQDLSKSKMGRCRDVFALALSSCDYLQ